MGGYFIMEKLLGETLINIEEIKDLTKTGMINPKIYPLYSFIYEKDSINELMEELKKSLKKDFLTLFKKTLENIKKIRDLVETKTINIETYPLYSFFYKPGFIQDLISEIDCCIELLDNNCIKQRS